MMATKKEEVKFEDNLAELENIVRKLESGDVALEDAIAEFQKGMKISETLKKTLNEAEETLVKIVGKDGQESEFSPEQKEY
jgi:exodeoxyribonuclease VII small subunit